MGARPRLQLWTFGQRKALLCILLAVLIYLVVQAVRHPVFVSDPQPLDAGRASELVDRIDPNTADAQTLAALPTLGEKRAQLIIDYRERHSRQLPNRGPAFRRLEDLLRIRGIGPATIEQIAPYLEFPTTGPSTAESD